MAGGPSALVGVIHVIGVIRRADRRVLRVTLGGIYLLGVGILRVGLLAIVGRFRAGIFVVHLDGAGCTAVRPGFRPDGRAKLLRRGGGVRGHRRGRRAGGFGRVGLPEPERR